MKKILLLSCLILLTGCGNKQVDSNSFKGKIIECNENSMIVKPDENEEEFRSSDQFNIAFTEEYQTCKVNDYVKIEYTGGIEESYPAQINVQKIELIRE